MAVDIHPAASETTPHLVAGIVSDAQKLVKQEINLFKQEIRDDIKKKRDAVIKIVVGAIVGLVSLIILTHMASLGLHAAIDGLPLWGAYAITGFGTCFLAAALILWGWNEFGHIPIIEENGSPQPEKENEPWTQNRK